MVALLVGQPRASARHVPPLLLRLVSSAAATPLRWHHLPHHAKHLRNTHDSCPALSRTVSGIQEPVLARVSISFTPSNDGSLLSRPEASPDKSFWLARLDQLLVCLAALAFYAAPISSGDRIAASVKQAAKPSSQAALPTPYTNIHGMLSLNPRSAPPASVFATSPAQMSRGAGNGPIQVLPTISVARWVS